MYILEKNVPIPARTTSVKKEYPWDQMSVGDSFTVQYGRNMWQKRDGTKEYRLSEWPKCPRPAPTYGIKTTYRTVEKHGSGDPEQQYITYRVWRTA